MYPPDLDETSLAELAAAPDELCRGGSAIVGPLGEVIAGPLYGREGILTAPLDLTDLAAAKLDFDVVGHYARPDLFRFRVRQRPRAEGRRPSAEC